MTGQTAPAGLPLKAALWIAQIIVAAMFLMGAVMKLTMPREQLAATMAWTADVHPGLVIFTGIVDGLGSIGILLPALTRIKPELTVLAAKGCVLLQVCAFIFHVSRGEGATLAPMNIVLGGLAAFVVWGRSSRAPILPR